MAEAVPVRGKEERKKKRQELERQGYQFNKGDPGTTAGDVQARQPQPKPVREASPETRALVDQAGDTPIPSGPRPPTLGERFTPRPLQSPERQQARDDQAGNLAQALPEAVGEAAVGAGIGAAVGGTAIPAVGAIPGAVIGAGVGLARSIYNNLKEDKRQRVLTEDRRVDESIKGMKAIINEVELGGDPEEALELWGRQVQKVRIAQQRIEKENRGKVLDAEAEDELVVIEEFFDTIKPRLDAKLAKAIDQPTGTPVYNLDEVET